LDIGERKWQKAGGMHSEEFHDLYASPNIIRGIKSRRMRWSGHLARIGEMKNLKGRELGRPRSRWEDNIRMDLSKIGWEDVN
jgi:hypothetical protein